MSDNTEDLKEEWKFVTKGGYTQLYEISTFGNVRRKTTGRTLKKEISYGYYRVSLAKPGMKNSSEHELVHRLVASAFIPNINNKNIVNHKDGNKLNNNAANLEWVTQKENVKHAFETGLRESKGKPIIIIDCNGDIFEYTNQRIAQKEAKLGENTILRALKFGNKPFGMTIKYKNDADTKLPIDLSNFEELINFPGYFINRETLEIYGKISERILKIRISAGGYPIVSMCKNKKVIQNYLHIVVAKHFIPNPDNLPVVNHIDHNKLNYNIDNLEWVTFKENTRQYLKMKQNNSVLSESLESDSGSEETEVEEESEL